MSRTQIFRSLRAAVRTVTSHRGRLSRRDLLRGAAALASAPTLALPHAFSFERRRSSLGPQRVAIVGGGLAGLTLAYRLQNTPNLRVTVFEAASRFGGRVSTRTQFNPDGHFCENGAELVDSHHEDLKNLVHDLGLELQNLNSDDPLPDQFKINGEVFGSDDFLPGGARHSSLQNLVNRVAQDHRNESQWDTIPLSDYLRHLASDQDKSLLDLIRVAYVGEYGLNEEDQSALNFISMFATHSSPPVHGLELFGDSDESYRIRGGSESVIHALVQRIHQRVPLNLSHMVESVRRTSDDRWRLSIRSGHRSEDRTFEVVVFAIPYSVLSRVAGISTSGCSAPMLHMISQLKMGTNTKGFLGFARRFWRSGEQPFSGALTTDQLPEQFWETSRGQTGNHGILTNFLGGSLGETGLSSEQKETAIQFLSRTERPQRYDQVVWRKNPWSRGSYSSPGVGQFILFRQVHQNLGAHLPPGLFLIGEQSSAEFQGFMNGSVETAERVAAQLSQSSRAVTI